MIIVVRKTSQFDKRGEQIRGMVDNGLLEKDFLERLKVAHDEHIKTYETLVGQLKSQGVEFSEKNLDDDWTVVGGVEAVVTVGGDGTVLSASHKVQSPDVPLIGVRSSSSSVGHLCYIRNYETSGLVEEIQTKALKTVQVERLFAKVVNTRTTKDITTPPVLNDVLYANSNPAETTRYKVVFKDITEVHKSSGMWIATAAGSTAAIGAAGGVEYPVDFSDFQYVVREPYSPPGETYEITSGIFNPENDIFEIENRCQKGFIAIDGHHGMVELELGDVVSFGRSIPLRLARQHT